ncbi:MAG: M14 family metallopeptidase, partial [Acidobacteriota bacterium]
RSGAILLRESFSPRTREIPYLKVLPEWGKVKVATGWLTIKAGQKTVYDQALQSDLEKFWEYFQAEGLTPLYSQIMKKTGNEPSTAKQPYFKRLLVELWMSEPDYRLGLDEEIVSSLEAMHDEIYFDTLDFLRGITRVEAEDQDVPEDTSRLSAPGNIFPLIHPSVEGEKGRVKIVLEDWQAASSQAILKWKVKGREEEYDRALTFPALKPKSSRWPGLIFNGKEDRLENLSVALEFEKETDYLALLEIVQNLLELQKQGLLPPSFSYPRLGSLTLKIKHQDLEKEEIFVVAGAAEPERRDVLARGPAASVVTDQIISPEMCLEMVRGLAKHAVVRSYIGGRSYENREIPVIEIFTPQGPYISLARLLAAKPTLFLSARQHANEVSSTSYLLRFAELLATDAEYQEYTKKMNFVMQPMENPDGAALAYELQKLTPFHSLHAGRYSSLGVEIGYQSGISRPFLPEAAVRKNLQERWLPDIYLNLHGYPSHEWVQAFSSYVPYLFRDYWVPKGWFAYYRAPRLRLYDKWKEAGDALRGLIVEEMQKDTRLKESNERFYDRFRRWAARWQPHISELELHEGLNLYAARRSGQESRLTPRTKVTYVEETPELMDETAQGPWLEFLCRQGLTYLRAHAEYLSWAAFERARIEEEVQDRIRIQFVRGRPGRMEDGNR